MQFKSYFKNGKAYLTVPLRSNIKCELTLVIPGVTTKSFVGSRWGLYEVHLLASGIKKTVLLFRVGENFYELIK